MALTFELAQFTVRKGEEEPLLAERPEMVQLFAYERSAAYRQEAS